MSENGCQKYRPFPALNLPGRTWASKTLSRAPRWLSTDLRDGNQALVQPMDGAAKLQYFHYLLTLGYKEIEISYPSASQTEFDFTRRLITTGAVPDDVWIQVMAPCREELIRTTIEAARGAKQVIVHIHLSTSPCFQEVVFNMTEQDTIALATRCARLIRELTKDSPDPELRKTEWTLEFTPENFQDTSPEFAVEICEAVKAAWEPTKENQIIFNLAATVEVAMPNVFADQIEFFCSHISEREKVCVSLHNHNDRGCAVAAAEMGQLAGADRVEGCLFGNGERTGNVDLVTLAMNLHTQGVRSGIDLSNINGVVDLVERLTKIPVHMRAPYAGKYTFCTFTGSHQDAIRKGYKSMAHLEKTLGGPAMWRMPYLPMDPADLGRKHEAIIRLNSQSGKGGIGWYINEIFEIDLPRDLEIEFAKKVKAVACQNGVEVTHEMIEDLFRSYYMLSDSAGLQLLSCKLRSGENSTEPSSNGDSSDEQSSDDGTVASGASSDSVQLEAAFARGGNRHETIGSGHDVLTSALGAVEGLVGHFDLLDYQAKHWPQHGDDMMSSKKSAIFVKLATDDKASWGAGIHEDPVWASLQAILSAGDKVAAIV